MDDCQKCGGSVKIVERDGGFERCCKECGEWQYPSEPDLCRCGHHDEDHTSFGCGMVLVCTCKCFVLFKPPTTS